MTSETAPSAGPEPAGREASPGGAARPAAPGLPLGSRLWGWLQGRANPIVVKELRATVRQRRFLLIHFLAVAVLAVLVVGVVVATGGREMAALEASEVGQTLFYVCAAVQAIFIVLLVPGMTAPALVEERANQSLDLLITTRLSPREIVVGKLLASLVTVFILLASWMPLVAVTFLFGGVGMLEVVLLYVQLVALAVVLAALSLHCSAVERSPRRAVTYAYFLTFLVGGGFYGAAVFFWTQVALGAWRFRQFLRTANGVLLVVAVPAYFFVLLTGAFLLSAINRMKPASANRSTNVRAFLTAMVLVGGGLFVGGFLINVGALTSGEAYGVLAMYLAVAAVVPLLVALVFATEEPVRFERLRRRRARLRGWRAPLRPFFPGPGSGATLALLLAILLVVVGVVVGFWGPGVGLSVAQKARLAELAGLVLASVLLTAGLGWAVGARLQRVSLSRFVVLVLVVGLFFGPLVSLLIRSGRVDWQGVVSSRLRHGDYLSAVVSAVAVANPRGWTLRGREMPQFLQTPLGPLPLEALTLVIYVVLGVAGLVLGRRWEERFEAGLPPLESGS